MPHRAKNLKPPFEKPVLRSKIKCSVKNLKILNDCRGKNTQRTQARRGPEGDFPKTLSHRCCHALRSNAVSRQWRRHNRAAKDRRIGHQEGQRTRMKQENKTENKNQTEKQDRKGGGNQTGQRGKNQIDKAERKQKNQTKKQNRNKQSRRQQS